MSQNETDTLLSNSKKSQLVSVPPSSPLAIPPHQPSYASPILHGQVPGTPGSGRGRQRRSSHSSECETVGDECDINWLAVVGIGITTVSLAAGLFGLISILDVYLRGIQLAPSTSNAIINALYLVNFAIAIVGGGIADKWLGKKLTIICSTIIMITGFGILFISSIISVSHIILVSLTSVALCTIGVGAGSANPCLTSLLGEQLSLPAITDPVTEERRRLKQLKKKSKEVESSLISDTDAGHSDDTPQTPQRNYAPIPLYLGVADDAPSMVQASPMQLSPSHQPSPSQILTSRPSPTFRPTSLKYSDTALKRRSVLLEACYNYFYMSFNLGAFISQTVTSILQSKVGNEAAFGLVLSLASLTIPCFLFQVKNIKDTPPSIVVLTPPSQGDLSVPPTPVVVDSSSNYPSPALTTVVVYSNERESGVGKVRFSENRVFPLEPESSPLLNAIRGTSSFNEDTITSDVAQDGNIPPVTTSTPLLSSTTHPPPLASATVLSISNDGPPPPPPPASPMYSEADIASLKRLSRVFLPLPIFWGLFFTAPSLWTTTAGQMNLQVGAFKVPQGLTQALNPLFDLMLIPIFVQIFHGFDWSPLRRMTIGMLFSAASLAVAGGIQVWINHAAPNSVSVLWQCPMYFLMSIAEILTSITGLEFAYTQAPDSLKGFIMGLFFLCQAVGNLLVMVIAIIKISSDADYFFLSSIMVAFVCAFYFLNRNYQYREPDRGGRATCVDGEGSARLWLATRRSRVDKKKTIWSAHDWHGRLAGTGPGNVMAPPSLQSRAV